MTNLYTPLTPRRADHFVTSKHGTLTFIEALTTDAKQFLAQLGFSAKAAVTYNDLRELRYAARDAGLSLG